MRTNVNTSGPIRGVFFKLFIYPGLFTWVTLLLVFTSGPACGFTMSHAFGAYFGIDKIININ